MLGDDPDPTVTTNRVGYGTTFGRAGGDRGLTREVSWFDKREPKTRLVSERSTKTRGERGNYERMQVLKTMTATSADAMRMMP